MFEWMEKYNKIIFILLTKLNFSPDFLKKEEKIVHKYKTRDLKERGKETGLDQDFFNCAR